MAKIGRPKIHRKPRRLSLTIESEAKEIARGQAQDAGISLSAFIQKLILSARPR